MKSKSYKELSYKELLAKRDELYKELVDLRFKKQLGTLENQMAIKNTRHNIARINTRIRAIELGIDKAASSK